MLHLALYHPAIPQNTGNIARLCVGMEPHLHVIGPTPFEISDKTVRRAGLDYWDNLTITIYENEDDFLSWLGERVPWLVTKFGDVRFDDAVYKDEDIIILGNENTGLSDDWHDRWPGRRLFVPMPGPIRSFNLANTAAIVLAQASLRVNGEK